MPAFAARKKLDVTEAEIEVRSLYMRLYRSRIEGDAAYPAKFVNGHADALIDAGHIQRLDDGYRLTEAGVRAWAEMCAPLLSSRHSKVGAQNELRWLTGNPLCRPHLGEQALEILQMLVNAGGKLPLAAIHAISYPHSDTGLPVGLGTLKNAVYIIIDGEDVKLTGAGWQIAREIGIKAELSGEAAQPPGNQSKVKFFPIMERDNMNDKICKTPGCDKPCMTGGNGKPLDYCPDHQREEWRKAKERQRDRELNEDQLIGENRLAALKLLDDNRYVDDGWIKTGTNTVHYKVAEWLESEGYAEYDPEERRVRIRHAGHVLVARTVGSPHFWEDYLPQGETENKQPADTSHSLKAKDKKPPLRGGQPPGASEAAPAHDCADCIYKEVVEALGAKNPKIAELVEVMLKARGIREQLEI